MDKKIKYLEMIQGIINRMANNSFLLKGWAVSIVAGIFALAGKTTNNMYILFTVVPIIIFYFLDAYYLQQERLYRVLYEKVRLMDESEIDFDLKASTSDDMNKNSRYSSCLKAKAVFIFYLPLAIADIIIILLIVFI